MRKNVFGRQFKRDANERKALFRNLMSELVLHERIKTTEEKAKAIKGSVEKLVTKAKKNGTSATAVLTPFLTMDAASKMVRDVAPRFTNRPGGYTRIVRLERRLSDNATMVLMEWVEKGTAVVADQSKKKSSPKAKATEIVSAEAVTAKKAVTKKKATVKKAPKKEETK